MPARVTLLLDVRTILSVFIAELRDEARRKGLSFRAETWRGKGGHMMVFVGDRLSTVPSREIDPKTARKSRKQLGLAD